jgi:transcriptional regulator of acetoin/glycerol metabolism
MQTSADVMELLSRRSWPGGVGEIEALLREAAAEGDRAPELSESSASGWLQQLNQSDEGFSISPARIIAAMDGGEWKSIAEICRATGLARRTALRHINDLVSSGYLVRFGRGRATKYRHAAGHSRDAR